MKQILWLSAGVLVGVLLKDLGVPRWLVLLVAAVGGVCCVAQAVVRTIRTPTA